MDAIGVAVVAIGGFLLYASVRGRHPWTLFQQTVGTYKPVAPTGSAPYTGTFNSSGLAQGVSQAGGGTGAIHP